MQQENEPQARILLADDDPALLRSLSELLRLYDYEVATVADGGEAIAELGRASYDLLLLDMQMPRRSGQEVLRHVREHDIDVMTIVVSGKQSFEPVSGALRNGAHDYVRKPYVAEELLVTVRNAIRKKQLADHNKAMQRRLRRSEQLHRFIVNNSPDLVFILDREERFSFLNAKLENLLGYNRETLIGEHVSAIVDAGHVEELRQRLNAARDGGGLQILEVSLLTRDGDRRDFEVTVWAAADSDPAQLHGDYRTYGTARDITARKQAESFINFQAYHDLLTHLPNRTLFHERLSASVNQAALGKLRPAVVFIDLDRFKIINDSLGHTHGDALLRAVAERLRRGGREGDTLGRFGGDEFTLLLPHVPDEDAAEQIGQKILGVLRQPFRLHGHELHVTASVGIALYPEGGTTADELIKSADVAMYGAKHSGKDACLVFNPQMLATIEERLALEQELRHAASTGQLAVHYQAQTCSETGRVVGVEALARWSHPIRGEVAPSTFIPVAEESGLIVELDLATLRRACRDIRILHQQGQAALVLSVNVSPVLFSRGDCVERILAILDEECFPAERLELEITEGLLMDERSDVAGKLQRLRDKGIAIALDDFGTGYSALGYLHKFPISTLKIDRSFVESIGTKAQADGCIIQAMIAIAKGLKLRLVAEGVEHHAQLEYLRQGGCSIMQGFLFGKACSLAQFAAQSARLQTGAWAREADGAQCEQ